MPHDLENIKGALALAMHYAYSGEKPPKKVRLRLAEAFGAVEIMGIVVSRVLEAENVKPKAVPWSGEHAEAAK